MFLLVVYNYFYSKNFLYKFLPFPNQRHSRPPPDGGGRLGNPKGGGQGENMQGTSRASPVMYPQRL